MMISRLFAFVRQLLRGRRDESPVRDRRVFSVDVRSATPDASGVYIRDLTPEEYEDVPRPPRERRPRWLDRGAPRWRRM